MTRDTLYALLTCGMIAALLIAGTLALAALTIVVIRWAFSIGV